MRSAEKMGVTKNIRLKYFTVTFYKKGTCHFTITNEELLKKFNIFGSEHKGWLPPCYGKKKYQDMTDEERSVIDSFQGEAEYNKVLCNKDYYLSDVGTMLMLDVAEKKIRKTKKWDVGKTTPHFLFQNFFCSQG